MSYSHRSPCDPAPTERLKVYQQLDFTLSTKKNPILIPGDRLRKFSETYTEEVGKDYQPWRRGLFRRVRVAYHLFEKMV